MKDLYSILNIQPDATPEEIKKAYKTLVLKYHPDKHNGDIFYTNRFQEIHNAYKTLIEPQERAIYDEELFYVKGNDKDIEIVSFQSNKRSIKTGEDFVLSWHVTNATNVTVLGKLVDGDFCFEKLPNIGEKSIQFNTDKNMRFTLIASNKSYTQKKNNSYCNSSSRKQLELFF